LGTTSYKDEGEGSENASDLRRRIDTALAEAARWELLDKVLLDLCKTYPTHKIADQVSAKVTLIGRTYATGVERAFKGRSGQGDALTKVVNHMHSNGKTVDKILAVIPSSIDVLTEDAIGPVVRGHSRLLEATGRVRGL
jgi:hypothetical protein